MKNYYRSKAINIKNIIEIDEYVEPSSLHIHHYMEDNRKVTKLAIELADALNDHEAILLYVNFVEQFPESVLRKVLAKVLAIPRHKIKKTRGALFNYLMQQHGFKRDIYNRD